LKKWEPRYLTLRGKMTVIGSLVASTCGKDIPANA
jgi:hypothetical protein